MDIANALIVSPLPKLPPFAINETGNQEIEAALTASALIGKVTDRDSKIIAVRAQQQLKGVIAKLEKVRVQYKEPILLAGRQVDGHIAEKTLPLDKEFGRVSNAVKEFDDAERRRVLEEERLQREELTRIEREKQAELDRIAREQREREEVARRAQEEADRKVRESAEAAAKLAAEATNKKQREAAERAVAEAKAIADKAAMEKEIRDGITNEQAQAAAAQVAAIEEKAGNAAYVAAKPIEITHVAGQRTTADWEITKINDWVLAKARPDLVSKITFDMRALKDCLKRGDKLPGVEAREVYNAGVKLPPERKAIEV